MILTYHFLHIFIINDEKELDNSNFIIIFDENIYIFIHFYKYRIFMNRGNVFVPFEKKKFNKKEKI
jgi:hypothetical protein